MADVHSKEIRSYNMSMIKGQNTKPEIIVRKFLHSNGYRFRINDKRYPGKPDIILPKYRTVVLINGCFWHGHESCKYFIIPKTRSDWWLNKINKTKYRDLVKKTELEELGWKVIVVWECELKNNKMERLGTVINEIKENR